MSREQKTVVSNRFVRYGYANELFRVVLVHINANENQMGGALHQVEGIGVSSGKPRTWFVADAGLPRVTNKT